MLIVQNITRRMFVTANEKATAPVKDASDVLHVTKHIVLSRQSER